MTGALQRFARRWWAGEAGLPGAVLSVVLTPLSWLWAVVTAVANRRHDRHGGVTIDGVVVVSVGNLAVGGTGKTPLASWVAQRVWEAGGRPALLLSGYGRDEALLHRSWTPDVPLVVDADRVAGARRAGGSGAGVVILDDGFQHRSLARSLDLVLLAVEDPFPGRPLPCGPYREGVRALARAHAVILTRHQGTVDDARRLEAAVLGLQGGVVTASVWMATEPVRTLVGGDASPGLENPLVVTAIARPQTFLREVALRCQGSAELLAFADHHEFTANDARRARARAGDRPIVMTEKDAVKLVEFSELLEDAFVVGQRLEWDWGEDDVKQLLASLVAAQAA